MLIISRHLKPFAQTTNGSTFFYDKYEHRLIIFIFYLLKIVIGGNIFDKRKRQDKNRFGRHTPAGSI